MNKILKLIIALLLCTVKSSFAYDVEVDGIYYNLENATASVTYNNEGNLYEGDLSIPASIIVDNNEYIVNKIGYAAFWKCENLTAIVLPNSITEISDYAFGMCVNLRNINLPDNLSVIGYAAFSLCSSFTKIHIPKSVESIQPLAFAGCYSVNDVSVDTQNTHYDSRGGCNAIISTATNALLAGFPVTTIPNDVVEISYGAFYHMLPVDYKSPTLIIPGNVKTIQDYAFWEFMYDIKLSEGIETIGNQAFFNTGMKEIIVPNSVRSIGDYAFQFQQKALKIHIGCGVETIGNAAFTGYLNAYEMTVDKNNSYYTSYEEFNVIVENSTKTIIAGCDNERMPDFIEAIGEEAYAYSSFNEFTIEPTVKSIGDRAFARCQWLTSIYSAITDPFEINENVFYVWDDATEGEVFTSATLYVPKGTLEKYRATKGWTNFANIVETDFPSNIKSAESGSHSLLPIYNINGQRVGKGNKGLLIQNKKKLLVK